MKRFLYLTPYFPPQTRVGALRPLKFARHLPAHGWAPVVLSDIGRRDVVDPDLYDLVPGSCDVVWDYSRRAIGSWQAFEEGRRTVPKTGDTWEVAPPMGALHRVGRRILEGLPLPGPEFLPLGEHSPRMHHALRSGRRLLEKYSCKAIMVNADPYATCLVGRRLGRETGLPVIHDLRDPWALCDLRRPLRPAPQRRLVDWMERKCVEDCARFLLNTRTVAEQYREHYREIPSGRFDFIRNHCDPGIISDGEYPPGQRYTLLFLGNLRRFVEGEVLLEVLAELRKAGLSGGDVVLRVTGQVTEDALRRADHLGVQDMLEDHPFVPYREVGTFMETADLLVSVSHASRQRIPAKIYDYAMSSRPLLIVGDNPELNELLDPLGAVTVRRADDIVGIADAVGEEMRKGRRRTVDRSGAGLDSATASRKLARILDEVTDAVGR